MEKISTVSRIHPIMAIAAVSVILFCGAGIAAITGVLPASKAVPAPGELGASSELTAGATVDQADAPKAVRVEQIKLADEQPAAQPVAHKPRKAVAHHHVSSAPQYAQADRSAAPQPVTQSQPAAQQPNYVGIGAGALIGGLIGNQVGGGRGRTLATVAGAIGGGMIGNEVAKRQQP